MWLLLLYLWLKTCNESRSCDTINESSFMELYNWNSFLMLFVENILQVYIHNLGIAIQETLDDIQIALDRIYRKHKYTFTTKLMKSCSP